MADLISAALIERDGMVLTARRKAGAAPFAGQWLLPMTLVRDAEAAEDALRRHAREQFGVAVTAESFIETVYLEDPAGARRYVTNIFRATLGDEALRFRAGGDYDDARWLAEGELADVWMPPALRDPLLRIMRGEAPPAEMDWEAIESATAIEGVPLGEQREEPAVDEPAPDNRASWDAISAAYQKQRFGERYGDRLMWSWRLSEDNARVLDDVRGRRVIVLGCGGGQDCVALSKMGAVAVGIDQSAEQIEYAKSYALRHGAENASFVQGPVEDLSRFDDDSFDLAVSSHALNYVERIEDALREAHRVLRGGGSLVIAVGHPFNSTLTDSGVRVQHSYFEPQRDWSWDFEGGVCAPFRQWFWSISQWFDMLAAAGFTVERIIEPREDVLPAIEAETEKLDNEWLRRVPYTLILKARKR